jgi:hypothetical protein
VTPSWAVTITVIVFGPIANGIGPDGVPVITGFPFTVTEAVGSVVVGVTVMLVVAFVTPAVWAVIAPLNAGVNVPELSVRLDKVAVDDCERLTVTRYVSVVKPSCAVTKTVIRFGPTINGIDPEAVPDGTAVPFTSMVDVGSVAVGVKVILVTLLATITE